LRNFVGGNITNGN